MTVVKIKNGFNISIGWSLKKYKSNQRLEPLTSNPIIGTRAKRIKEIINNGITNLFNNKVSIIEIKNIINNQALGVMLSCVSPENYEANLNEVKNLGVPFGFKLNGFITTKPNTSYTENYLKSKTGNPTEVMGKREDLNPEKMARIVKKFKDAGATILGGCCETSPLHIEAMAKLK